MPAAAAGAAAPKRWPAALCGPPACRPFSSSAGDVWRRPPGAAGVSQHSASKETARRRIRQGPVISLVPRRGRAHLHPARPASCAPRPRRSSCAPSACAAIAKPVGGGWLSAVLLRMVTPPGPRCKRTRCRGWPATTVGAVRSTGRCRARLPPPRPPPSALPAASSSASHSSMSATRSVAAPARSRLWGAPPRQEGNAVPVSRPNWVTWWGTACCGSFER